MQNLNPKFLEILGKIYSKEDIKVALEGFKVQKRNTSFRVNTLKSNNKEVEKYLTENNLEFEKVKFLGNAYIVKSSTENGELKELFESGKIYLQSISSQIPVELLDIQHGDKILDITASPGGKTSQAAAKLANSGEIVAVDNNTIRIDKLKFTLNRQGVKNVKVVKADARNLQEKSDLCHSVFDTESITISNPNFQLFDKIIADLPCSAEGKFNLNNEKSFAYWSEEVVKKNYKLQKEILKNIVPLLKVGGELVYSTCTINPYENEDIVHFVLCNFPEMELQDIKLDFEFVRFGVLKFENKSFKKEVSKSIRILPSGVSEGFFVAKFRKKEV